MACLNIMKMSHGITVMTNTTMTEAAATAGPLGDPAGSWMERATTAKKIAD